MHYAAEKQLLRHYCTALFPAKTVVFVPDEREPDTGLFVCDIVRGDEPTIEVPNQVAMVPATLTLTGWTAVKTAGSDIDLAEREIDSVVRAFQLINLSAIAASPYYVLDKSGTDFSLDFSVPFVSVFSVNDQSDRTEWSVDCPFMRYESL